MTPKHQFVRERGYPTDKWLKINNLSVKRWVLTDKLLGVIAQALTSFCLGDVSPNQKTGGGEYIDMVEALELEK